MAQAIKLFADRYTRAFEFLKVDLPKLRAESKIWNALLDIGHFTPEEAQAAVAFSGTPPLIWISDLGPSTWGQFDPDVPGRIEISELVMRRFEQDFNTGGAQKFLRAKVLHEMCHWGCQRKQIVESEEAGIAFERRAFDDVVRPWWSIEVPATPASSVATTAPAASYTDAAARAEYLQKRLDQRGFAPGRATDPNRRIFTGADVGEGMPRGFRNNNPGNIRVHDAWRGLAGADDMTTFQKRERDFCVFREPEWGLRAVAQLMRTYKHRHGLTTPRAIISRWAPASDGNNVEAYSRQIAKALGVQPDDTIDVDTNGTIRTIMRAIATHENGDTPPYADVQFQTALMLL